MKIIFIPIYRLAENDVEEGPTCDITTFSLSDQSTPAEQNIHQRYSLIIASPTGRSNDTTVAPTATTQTASAVAKPDIITTDPITLSVLSADFEDIVQHAFERWKHDSISTNNQNNANETLPFNTDNDYLLAEFLQRTENDQQNMHLHSIGN